MRFHELDALVECALFDLFNQAKTLKSSGKVLKTTLNRLSNLKITRYSYYGKWESHKAKFRIYIE